MKEFEIAFLLMNTIWSFFLFIKWSNEETFYKMFVFTLSVMSAIILISKFGIKFVMQ